MTDYISKIDAIDDDELLMLLVGLSGVFSEVLSTPPNRVTPPDSLRGRDRGFLSSSDREFLCGDWSTDSEYPQQVRSNNKARIRERAVNAFKDIPSLLALDADQRAKVYEELGRSDVRADLGALVAFVYLASDKDRELIEEAVADGIYTAESEVPPTDHEKGEVEDVSVLLDVEYAPNADDIYRRFQEKGPSSLSSGEIGILVQESKLSTEELIELNKTQDIRRAEGAAADVQQAIEASNAATFEEWKESPETPARDGEDSDYIEFPEGFSALVTFDSTHPGKDIRDFLDDEYLADR